MYMVYRLVAVRMQELACVDLSMEIAERSLEVVRSSIEAAAARERDEAAARLLSELELEDASKKVITIWLAMYRALRLQWPSLEQPWRGGTPDPPLKSNFT